MSAQELEENHREKAAAAEAAAEERIRELREQLQRPASASKTLTVEPRTVEPRVDTEQAPEPLVTSVEPPLVVVDEVRVASVPRTVDEASAASVSRSVDKAPVPRSVDEISEEPLNRSREINSPEQGHSRAIAESVGSHTVSTKS